MANVALRTRDSKSAECQTPFEKENIENPFKLLKMDLLIGNQGLNHLALHIFSYLDYPSIQNSRLVCQDWRLTIDEDQFWWLCQLNQILSSQNESIEELVKLLKYYQKRQGNLEFIKILLKSTKEYFQDGKKGKDSILFWAVNNDKIDTLEALIPTYDFNETDIYGRTALHWSCKLNYHQIISFILNHSESKEIDVNASADIRGQTPLHWACKYGNEDTVKLLLDCSRIDFNAKDQADQTALYAAIGEAKIDVVKLLIFDERIDLNATDALGMTPLHWSCFYHYSNINSSIYEDIVKLILSKAKEKSIDVNATDLKGRTPEDLARFRGFHGIVKILKKT